MVDLRRGDIFVTDRATWLSRIINSAQRFWSADGQAEYSHAGIILNPSGDTFESMRTIKIGHIDAYVGQKMLIGRAIYPTEGAHGRGIVKVCLDHKGQIYPFWRLFLHLVPPLAKYVSSGKFPVCSELVTKKEIVSGVKPWGNRWAGRNPDHIADAIRRWDSYEVVYEGVWEPEKAEH